MKKVRPRAEALPAMLTVGGGEGFPHRFFRTSGNKLHVYFLSNLGQGGPQSSIHSHAQDVQEVRSQTSPLGREQGRKEVDR
jgi:hypothetical protein